MLQVPRNCIYKTIAPVISELALDIAVTLDFTQLPDELRWMWTKTEKYSASSFYRVWHMGGTIDWGFKEIWISPAPSKVRIFAYLLLHLHGKIHTDTRGDDNKTHEM